ncbi:hypothetical protein [Sphingomonas glacialis]|uniref:Uncharacterized protein n=1 Tax=Sphingomonas glacialis TaxID=658225 RepID=A0A502FU84_9SPHN|nr:hypothetical protein [Sphingomonas glacialis]TPG53014.1 hypothetical protein EAH76_14350 [Sphingomonas glacialis]
MSLIELAERKAHARALGLYVFAGLTVVMLGLTFSTWRPSFFEGMWLGFTLVSTLYLSPLATRLKSGPLAQLLEDEVTRDHRRTSSAIGFWAGLLAAAAMLAVGSVPGLLSASDSARIIFTAAIVVAQVRLATLELQAAR